MMWCLTGVFRTAARLVLLPQPIQIFTDLSSVRLIAENCFCETAWMRFPRRWIGSKRNAGVLTRVSERFCIGDPDLVAFFYTNNPTINNATMFATLIIGLMAGPAVSF